MITPEIETINKWLKSIDEDSFIDSVHGNSPTYYLKGEGICSYGANGSLDIIIINTDPAVPAIRIRCFEVSSVDFSYNCELNVILEQDSFGTRLYLHGKDSSAIHCEFIEVEILGTSYWRPKEHLLPKSQSSINLVANGIDEEINNYYSLSPIDFQILKSIEIKPIGPYFNKLSVYIMLSNGDHTKTLHLYFEDVREFFFNQPERSSIHFMLSIREKNELGLYRVLCEEQDEVDVIGFYCSFFTATIA